MCTWVPSCAIVVCTAAVDKVFNQLSRSMYNINAFACAVLCLPGAPRSEQYNYGARFLGSTLLDEGRSHAVFAAALKKARTDQESVWLDHSESRVSVKITVDGIRWVTSVMCTCRQCGRSCLMVLIGSHYCVYMFGETCVYRPWYSCFGLH